MKPKAGTLKRSVKLINFQVDWSKRKQEGRNKLSISGMKEGHNYRYYK